MNEIDLFSPDPDRVITPETTTWRMEEFDGSPVLTVYMPEQWREVNALCRLTGHTNASKAVRDLVDPAHVRKLNTSTAWFPNHGYGTSRAGNPVKLFVSREGANHLILDSRVPQAQRLKAWLAGEVLPAIEDTGSYVAPGATLALPDLSGASADVLALVGKLGEAASLASRVALEAQGKVRELEAVRAEEAPLVEQARHIRSTRALSAVADFANDLLDWVLDEGITADIQHADVRDYLGYLGLIVRGSTVRNNAPTSRAIKAGYVRPHNHNFGVTTRLTKKGWGYAWDRITPHIKATGSAKPPARKDGAA